MTRERSTKLNEADSEGDTEASMVRREALLQYSPAEPGDWRHRWESFLSGLKRITSSGDYIPEIDGLRFIAISAVVLYHVATFVNMAQSSKGGVFELGARGVELFFVISGFVLAVPFAAQYTGGTRRVRLKDYFIRRLIRLEPPYLLSLFLLCFLKIVGKWDYFPGVLVNLAASTFYLHNAIFGWTSAVSVVAWSLEIEVQFYLLMPVFGLLFMIPSRWARRAIFIGVMLAAVFVQPIGFPALWYRNESHLLNYIQYFFAGLLLADIYVMEWQNRPPAPRNGLLAWGDLAWLFGWPLLVYTLKHGGRVEKYAFPALIFFLYWAMFQSVWPRRLMRVPFIAIVGGMCYSIYLLHNTVIQLVARPIAGFLPSGYYLGVLVLGLITTPFILLICGLYFRWIERPCMRRDWPKRFREGFERLIFVEEAEEDSVAEATTAPAPVQQPSPTE